MKERDKLPPEVPETLAELNKAVMLLGSRAKGPLKQKNRQVLAALLGKEPRDEEQAAVWKSALKTLRREERQLFDAST